MKIYKKSLKAVSEVSGGGHLEFMLISPFPMVQFYRNFYSGVVYFVYTHSAEKARDTTLDDDNSRPL